MPKKDRKNNSKGGKKEARAETDLVKLAEEIEKVTEEQRKTHQQRNLQSVLQDTKTESTVKTPKRERSSESKKTNKVSTGNIFL